MPVRTRPDVEQLLALRGRLDPADPAGWTNLAWLAAQMGELDLARETARQAAALPLAPRAAWHTLEQLSLGRTDGLFLALPRVTTSASRPAIGSPLVAAVAAHVQAATAVAEACYNAAIADPLLAAAAWNGLAVLHEQRGEHPAADQGWQRSLAQPTVAALHNLVLAQLRRGDVARGRSLLAEYDRFVAGSAPLLFLVGYSALLDDDPAMARLSVQGALERDPGLVRAQFTLGLVSERLGRHQEAVVAIRRGLMMSPWFAPLVWLLDNGTGAPPIEIADTPSSAIPTIASDEVLLVLGRSLLEAGHLGEALGVFDQIILRDEQHTAALFHRGVVLAKLQRYREAAADWDGVLDATRDPDLLNVTRRHAESARRLAALFLAG